MEDQVWEIPSVSFRWSSRLKVDQWRLKKANPTNTPQAFLLSEHGVNPPKVQGVHHQFLPINIEIWPFPQVSPPFSPMEFTGNSVFQPRACRNCSKTCTGWMIWGQPWGTRWNIWLVVVIFEDLLSHRNEMQRKGLLHHQPRTIQLKSCKHFQMRVNHSLAPACFYKNRSPWIGTTNQIFVRPFTDGFALFDAKHGDFIWNFQVFSLEHVHSDQQPGKW